MKFRLRLAALAVPGLLALAACTVSSEDDTGASTDALSTGNKIADNARANLGKGACSRNSWGGRGFFSSCDGNGGLPEYWCADFARSMWYHAGVKNTRELSAAAGSFYCYGEKHRTLHNHPHVGDAVVFDYHGNCSADHVAIVTYVTSDGKGIDTISGDWDGESGSEAHFASTSHVIRNSPHYDDRVGDWPAIMGMKISGFISPE